jgi:hypothetical protein
LNIGSFYELFPDKEGRLQAPADKIYGVKNEGDKNQIYRDKGKFIQPKNFAQIKLGASQSPKIKHFRGRVYDRFKDEN